MEKLKKGLILYGIIMAFVGLSCQKNVTTTAPSPAPQNTAAVTAAMTYTGTATAFPSAAPTFTNSPTNVITAVFTPANTSTHTAADTVTGSPTPSLTFTFHETMTDTFSATETHTPSATLTSTETPENSVTLTVANTITITITITPAQEASPTYTPAATHTFTPVYLGSAVVSPPVFYSQTTGNEITFTYTAGDMTWAGGTQNGTLRIKIPPGWNRPSLDPADGGYFSVSVSGGALLGKSVDNTDILVSVRDLTALSGKITVIYGDMSFGPGAYVDGSGAIIIPVEVDEDSSDGILTKEINNSPQAELIAATPTPVVGEGTMDIIPSVVTEGSSGNTLEFTYTAGKTTWTASPAYGTLRISLPSGWSAPSTEISDPGYFYVTATAVGLWIGTQADAQDIIVNISGLEPYRQVKIYYGYKNFGGPGAEINGTGIFTLTTMSDTDGNDLYEIADSPEIEVVPPTSTITPTSTSTPTWSNSPTISQTWTITETSTISKTSTISATITQTSTLTITETSTPTPTVTLTPTPYWDIVGEKGFSAGESDYVDIFVYNGQPYAAYMDRFYSNKLTVKKYNGSVWETVGPPGFTEGISYEASLVVNGGMPYVAFRDYDYTNRVSVMRYNNISLAWEYVGGRGMSPGGGYGPSLFIYADEPYVAYKDSAFGEKASVRKRRYLIGWEDVGAAGFSDDRASSISMHIDSSSGIPYVAYRDWFNTSYRASVMKYQDSAWFPVGQERFSAGGAEYLSVFADSGKVYAAYSDTVNNGKITVKYYDGLSWATLGEEGFSSGAAQYISLYVCGGVPSVAFRDNGIGVGQAVIMKYNGASWELKAVLSDAGAEYVSLHFDESSCRPYIGFSDENQGGKVTVATYEGEY